jgi:hypothetical protein
MASPFQEQARFRKMVYIGLILVLFTLGWVWRTQAIAPQAERLHIREESRGSVELTGAVVRLGLTGSRGLVTTVLWNVAIERQKKNQWNQLEVLVRQLTRLQPHFITPWLFQSWNLAYNVSVEADRVRDKYFYIARGIELLAEGERQNLNHPDLRWSIGFYLLHKLFNSDETNYHRSLFQLSLIPPNERDPARFYTQAPTGPQFNWAEFEKFCDEHPQLIRRLKDGMQRESAKEKTKLFRCESAKEVVQFLQDNYQVPSVYPVPPMRGMNKAPEKGQAPEKLPPELQFPPLPPASAPWRKQVFDKNASRSSTRTP